MRVDKHGSVNVLPHPFDAKEGIKGQILKLCNS